MTINLKLYIEVAYEPNVLDPFRFGNTVYHDDGLLTKE